MTPEIPAQALDVWRALWPRRWGIVGGTLFTGLVMAGASLIIPEKFRAEILIMPAPQQGAGGQGALSGLARQLGGLGDLAGIGFATADKEEALATLQSRALTEQFIKDSNLLPTLFAGKWDEDAKRWKSTDPEKVPTLWDGEKVFRTQVRRLSDNRRTGLITLAITWGDPILAAKWANELVRRTNSVLRTSALERATRNIQYLESELKKTSVLEVQQAIYRVLEQELKTVMLAKGTEEYAFKVVDPAVPPEERAWPRRTLLTALGLLAGLLVSALVALVIGSRSST